ncbi:hypothetical protein RchiOBHm_Chr2g0144871 [Rosa chinensis]|uniref:Uncharacterized protein n=1 Tax=Rosa chinensis TaxID=74649 RepID=A0A2P6RYH1_ROSCH|nr:hypothetical protein RchiOBHm_Chr2g0144871 [Rosa chinensis]
MYRLFLHGCTIQKGLNYGSSFFFSTLVPLLRFPQFSYILLVFIVVVYNYKKIALDESMRQICTGPCKNFTKSPCQQSK